MITLGAWESAGTRSEAPRAAMRHLAGDHQHENRSVIGAYFTWQQRRTRLRLLWNDLGYVVYYTAEYIWESDICENKVFRR